VFLGAELTQVYAHQRGAPLIPRRHAEVIPHARGVAPALNPAANLAN